MLDKQNRSEQSWHEKCYVVLCVLFAIFVVTGNLVSQKFAYLTIPFYTFELSVGVIFYPITFIITNLITEFFGKDRARFCVRLAVAMSCVIALIIQVLDNLTATTWSKVDDQTFSKVFGIYGVVLISSLIANYTAQSVDIRLYLFIKRVTRAKYLWMRNIGTAISLFVDTSIVISLITIFGKRIPYEQMFPLILNSYSFKLLFLICSTPVFYLLVNAIKHRISNTDTEIT